MLLSKYSKSFNLFLMILIPLFFLGCVPQLSNKLDERVINPQNDQLFLQQDLSKCPLALKGTTVRLNMSFEGCQDPMKMQVVTISGFDTQMSATDIPYDGSWKEDIAKILKRNLSLACGTKFSDQEGVSTIDLQFKRLTSQIISIDQKHITDDFNLITLDSKLDYESSFNYVMDVVIGGTLFSKPFEYKKGLNIKNTGKQKASGTNYLITVSTRSESSRLIDVSILPENIPLYLQKNVFVQDMTTVLLPIITNENIISYTLYSPSGEIVKKNTISSHDKTLTNEPTDSADKAIINLFAGTSSYIGYYETSIAGPYGWLLYDLSKEIMNDAK